MRSTAFTNPRAGAARVGVIWLVAVLLVAGVALYLAFSAQSALTAAKSDMERARAEAAEAKKAQSAEAEFAVKLSKAVGWIDPKAESPRTNVDAIAGSFAELKKQLPDLGSNADTLQAALPLIAAALKGRADEVAALEERANGLTSELEAAQAGQARSVSEKDAEIAALNQRIADEAGNAKQTQDELQSRLDKSVGERSTLDEQCRSLEKQLEDTLRAHRSRIDSYEARLQQMKQVVAFAEPPLSDMPDARVLAVSDKLGSAWIDIGTHNRLVPGTRFRIESGGAGTKRVKGSAEVVAVEAEQSQVKLGELSDRFDPIVPGDVLVNPVYDPTGLRHAVLIGRFSGNYDAKNVRALLENMNIKVQDRVNLETNYLIVGSELWTDADGQALDAPLSPAELPAYKEAESLGVQIVPLSEFRLYFKM
jgi:HAMP domain-containing protein